MTKKKPISNLKRQRAFTYLKKNCLPEAKKIFIKICNADSSDIESWFALGTTHGQMGEINDAIKCFQHILSINPDHSNALSNLGIACMQVGKLEEAIMYFKKAASNSPDNVIAHFNLACILQEEGNHEEAIHYFENALRIHPNMVDAYINLGVSYKETGKTEAAINCYDKALNIQPDSYIALCNRGHCLRKVDKYEDAIPSYQNALALQPGSPEINLSLGMSQYMVGNYDEAEDSINRALEINPKFTEAWVDLGAVVKEQGRLEEALDYLLRAVNLTRNPPYKTYIHIIRILEQLGVFKELLDKKPFDKSIVPVEILKTTIHQPEEGYDTNIVFFLVGERDKELAEIMVASARQSIPKVNIVQLSDRETNAVTGINELLQANIDSHNLMFERQQMYAAFMATSTKNTVLLDADIVIQKDLSDVFSEWDIGLSLREPSDIIYDIMPFNEGVIFSRPTEAARKFWAATSFIYRQLPEYLRRWSGGQTSLGVLFKDAIKDVTRDVVEAHGVHLRLLPCDLYNYSPESQRENLGDKYIVHYKGERKKWMLPSTPGSSNNLMPSKNKVLANTGEGLPNLANTPNYDRYNNFIVSYPKAGRTWLKFLLGSIVCDMFELPKEQYANLYELSRTNHTSSNITDLLVSNGLQPFMFDHGFAGEGSFVQPIEFNKLGFNKELYKEKNIILMVRDPKDLLVSAYFECALRKNHFKGTIHDYIRSNVFGAQKVVKYYQNWNNHSDVPNRMLVIKYEDMHQDPQAILGKVVGFLGLTVSASLIDKAIEFARFENMKKMEKNASFKDDSSLRPKDPGNIESYKVRKGKVGGYRDYLSEDDVVYIENIMKEMECPYY